MATSRDQIEHLERKLFKRDEEKPWKNYSYSRRWLKRQMNKFIRRKAKVIEEDEISVKSNKKPTKGWEW